MANELKMTINLDYLKNGVRVQKSETFQVSPIGDFSQHTQQSIGTTQETIGQSADLGTPGYLLIKNLDSTNYVEVGSTSGVYDIKLKAGEFCLYRHNSATIYAKANTAACAVEYILIED